MINYVPFLGRLGLSLIFLFNGIMKVSAFDQTWHKIDLAGIPMAPMVLVLAIMVELGCGISVLIGFNARAAAWVLLLYLIPTTIVFHAFSVDHIEMDHLFKNIALIGGLLFVAHFGAGPLSLDAKKLW